MKRRQILLGLLASASLAACTAMMVGGGTTGTGPGADSADTAISSRVRQRLAADALLEDAVIGVRTSSGVVTLSGNVPTVTHRDQALRLARATSGVRGVTDLLRITN